MIDQIRVAAVIRRLADARQAALWAGPVARAMLQWGIDTPACAAAFLAQVAHESGGFVHVREIWGPTLQQKRYERDLAAAWPPTDRDPRNRLAHRLGNEEAGDGFRFRGHGLIQITGRSNHRRCGRALGLPLDAKPELLEQPEHAAMSAAWFWADRGLNGPAEAGDFETVTRKINGGLNGWKDRLEKWKQAKLVLQAN